MNWYYVSAGQQLGPIDQTRLRELVHAGTIPRDSLVWRDGMDGWKPYDLVTPDAPAMARYGGFWIRGLALFIDVLIVGLAYSIVQVPLTLMLGGPGFWTDGYVSSEGWPRPEMYGVPGMLSALWLVMDAAYHTYFVAERGATLGKLIFGLRVVTATGVPMTVGLALGRYLASWLSMFTIWIGYIIAAFDSQKRTLHDHICSTRVVRMSN